MKRLTTNQMRKIKIRLKKGDKVVVIAGRDKGQVGEVLAVWPKLGKVTVDGVNLARRHTKPRLATPQGGIIELTRPIWVSKVALVDPENEKPTRVGYRVDSATGSKQRFAKRSRLAL